MLICLLACFLFEDNLIQLKPTLVYEDIPEESGYLQQMRGTALSKDGKLYILDVRTHRIFCWDDKGKFLRAWGRSGEGPGEFDFTPRTFQYIFLSEYNGDVYVLNGANRRLSIFDSEGNFIKNIRTNFRNFVTAFSLNDKGDMFTMEMDYYAKPLPRANLHQYDEGLNFKQRFFTGVDRQMVPTLRGSDYHWRIKTISSPIVSDVMPDNSGIFVGDNENEEILIFKSNGKLVKKIKYSFPHLEVDSELKRHLKANIPKVSDAEYIVPDEFPAFQYIVSVEGLGFMVMNRDRMRNLLIGYLIDFGGKPLGRIKYQCNDVSYLDSMRGKVFNFYADDEGDYRIRRMDVSLGNVSIPSP